jgi:hypothetical protein
VARQSWEAKPVLREEGAWFGCRHSRGNSQPGAGGNVLPPQQFWPDPVMSECVRRTEHWVPGLWGRLPLEFDKGGSRGRERAAFPRRKEEVKRGRAWMLQNWKTGCLKQHIACKIILGDSSFSGAEQFWKLDYKI